MARIRSIKPEFFMHEGMAELPPLHRLLFIGLWTLADAKGRFEDRPKRIKASVLPYDDCDAEKMLADLADADFIVRYEVDGERFIAIPSFETHQRISGKEAQNDSAIPAPPTKRSKKQKGSAGEAPEKHPGAQEGKGRERKGVQEGREGALLPLPTASPSDLQQAWNELAPPPLPQWAEMGKKREAAARLRLAERPLAEWRAVISRLAASRFCRGENDRGWRAGPDFLLRPETAAKVLEGTYDDRTSKPRSTGAYVPIDPATHYPVELPPEEPAA